MDIHPTTPYVGAEVRGVDLGKRHDAETVRAVRDAVHAHGMVFLRDQHLDNDTFLAISRHFGEVFPFSQRSLSLPDAPEITRVSNIFENGQPIGLVESGQYWHTDRSFHAQPQAYGMLYAVEIPRDAGGQPVGDTLFASTGAAYDTLAPELQQRLQGRRAVHSYQNPYKTQLSPGRDNMIRLDDHHKPPVSHPIIRRHPATGRACLYVNQQYTETIEDMPHEEARTLIEDLCRHITRAETQYRHSWREGDLVIWDDCLVQHQAVGDYRLPQRRLLHRIGIKGGAPA